MRYTPKGKYTFDLINQGIEKITKQGLAGAAAGFVDNLNSNVMLTSAVRARKKRKKRAYVCLRKRSTIV